MVKIGKDYSLIFPPKIMKITPQRRMVMGVKTKKYIIVQASVSSAK